MRQIDEPEPQYALSEPVNRKPAPELTPIAGRPNWFQPRSGEPVYVEPTANPQSIPAG